MADNIVSLDSLDDLFADFIQTSLGLSSNQVLISYPEKGQKSSSINEDVVYVKTFQEEDESSFHKNRTKSYNPETQKMVFSQTSMRKLLLHVVFYGYNSDTLSAKLNELFHFSSTVDFLWNNNLSLIPDQVDYRNKIYEKINERWWKRVDLKIRLYNSITVEETTDIITSGDIKIYNQNGEIT